MANFANYGNLESVLTGYANKINSISEAVPSDASAENKLITATTMANYYTKSEVDALFDNILIYKYFDKVTHIATEEKFIEFLKQGYYTNKVVGYKVILSNTAEYDGGIWIIADVNHDSNNTGQSGCYDLISQDLFYSTAYNVPSASPVNEWRNCSPRIWLNDTFYNGFSNALKTRMIKPKYYSKDAWYNDDYIILPSKVELNGGIDTNTDSEGVVYPIFTDANSRIKNYNGTASKWWTRSRNITSTYHVWRVLANGGLFSDNYYNNHYLAPLLRVQ